MGAYRRHVELTDEELERLEAVMYLRPCAWVVSATGVSWSTAVSQARRCRASLTPSTTPIAALDGTSLTTQGSKKPLLSRTISLRIGASGVRSSSQLQL